VPTKVGALFYFNEVRGAGSFQLPSGELRSGSVPQNKKQNKKSNRCKTKTASASEASKSLTKKTHLKTLKQRNPTATRQTYKQTNFGEQHFPILIISNLKRDRQLDLNNQTRKSLNLHSMHFLALG
jgi:hypothetical protein